MVARTPPKRGPELVKCRLCCLPFWPPVPLQLSSSLIVYPIQGKPAEVHKYKGSYAPAPRIPEESSLQVIMHMDVLPGRDGSVLANFAQI